MSAPHSIGRHRYGVANVLSTISGSSCSCAIDASVSMSSTLPAGLPIVSPKNALVFARTALRHASGSSGIDPRQLDVHLAQQVLELVHRPAVQRRGRDDVVAGLEQREQRGRLRGDPAGERHRADAALEVRHPLLEDRDGRVHDARVRVPVLLQVEVRRSRLRDPRTRSSSSGRSAPRVRPCSGRAAARRAAAASRIRTRGPAPVGLRSTVIAGPSEKATDDRRLPRLLEQEAVVAVRRLDHVELDRLAERAERLLDLPRRRTAGTASRS